MISPLLPAQPIQPPVAAKRPITDVHHGVTVIDDYRWLEDYNDPAVCAWSDAQNAHARQVLDGIGSRTELRREVGAILGFASPSYFSLAAANGRLFALKRQPPKQQALLVLLESADRPGTERVVLDPAALDAKGGTAIDFFRPSKDGAYVAVSLSSGGSESGDLVVYDVATGQPLPDRIERVNGGTAGGSVAWNGDGTGFWYTRYPRAGERPESDLDFYQQVWFHKLGTPGAQDSYSLGRDFPRVAEIELESSPDGRYVLARMAYGDGGEHAHYLLSPGNQPGPGSSSDWVRFAAFADEIRAAHFAPDSSIILLSRKGAPRGKLLRLQPTSPALSAARLVVPESTGTVDDFLATASKLYSVEIEGGPSRLRVFDLATGAGGREVPVAPVSDVFQLVRSGKDDLLFASVSYLRPGAWQLYLANAGTVTRTALAERSPVSLDDMEVVRAFATSKDGTQVPLNIIRKKGLKLNGTAPVLLTAYGGYSISLTPNFLGRFRPLFDRGFVYVVANLRGGGEYGEQWHRAGNLTRKQNVFDDFAAAAQYLIANHYTTPSRLAIEGGSNGGLLMGAALTQHPDLFRAVVAHVGIYDMLRVELSPNGSFNVSEFGTVKEADQFRALYAYSPYHRVQDGTAYPSVLFMTGANDPRVDPMHSRKMTARLQASGTKRPVLLRTSSNSGHGIGTALSERIEQTADAYAFLCDQLGVK